MTEPTKPPAPDLSAAVAAIRGTTARPVRVRVEVEAPAGDVAGVFGRLAAIAAVADPGIAAAVAALVEYQRAEVANARRLAEQVAGLTEDVRNLDAKFADAVRDAAGFDPPAPGRNPWGDGGGDDSARNPL